MLEDERKKKQRRLQHLEREREENHQAVDKIVLAWNLQHNAKRYHDKVDAQIKEAQELVRKNY